MTNHPSACHPQAAAIPQAAVPRTIAQITKPTVCILSIKAPEQIDAVVAANRAKAPQNTPDALSAIFGPMYWAESPHAHAIAFAYSRPDISI